MRRSSLSLAAFAAAFLIIVHIVSPSGTAAPPDYDFEWAVIGDPGNPAYDGSLGGTSPFVVGAGSVDDTYRMSRLELTSAQWLPFVNMFAKQSDSPFNFGRPSRSGLDPLPGPPGHYRLDPDIPNAAMVPVSGLSWIEAAMYANWLNNGKPTDIADIGSGAYDLFDDSGEFNADVTRSPDAQFFLPNQDEWMKAAHWDPDRHGEGVGGWWRYSHSSDEPPVSGPPGEGETSAGDFLPSLDERFIPLGSYEDVMSPWGLWDTSGATSEYLEDKAILSNARFIEGSPAGTSSHNFLMFDHIGYFGSTSPISGGGGIRIASTIPSPGSIVALGIISLHLLGRSRRS